MQESFLKSFGGGNADTAAAKALLVREPLPHPDRQTLFHALSCMPDLGPQAAQAIVGAYPSLGAVIAAYQDPSKYVSFTAACCL